MDISWQPGQTLEQVERLVILKALRFYQGNKTQTASALGIAIRTLDNKLASYEGNPLSGKPTIEQPPTNRWPNSNDNSGGLQTKTEDVSGHESGDVQAEGRLSVEPIKEVPKKQAVPLRKRA